MNTRQFCWLISMAAAGFLCPGCEDSKNPLSDPQTSKADGRLAGVWRTRNEGGDVSYYHIGFLGDNIPVGVMRVVTATHSPDGKLNPPGEFLLFRTTLGQADYLNLTAAKEEQVKRIQASGWDPAIVGDYLLFKYRVEGDKLLVWPVDGDAKRRAIESGKLKGTIEQRGDDTKVRLTDTTENLARYVASAGDSLFSQDAVRLERVK
jgi:hypothetical protein